MSGTISRDGYKTTSYGVNYTIPTWVNHEDYNGEKLWTDYVYKSAESNRWWALNPNANESARFGTQAEAKAQYGLYSDFEGAYDGFLYDEASGKDLAYLTANMKTGNLDGALYSFGKIALINGAGGAATKGLYGLGRGFFTRAASTEFGSRILNLTLQSAEDVVGNFVSTLGKKGAPAAASAVDSATGKVYTALSGGTQPEVLHPIMRAWNAALNLPGFQSGASRLGFNVPCRAVTNCAEFRAVNNALLDGAKRLKTNKRQMYGRANFDLLRARVLHQA